MPQYVPGDILLVDDYSGQGDAIGNLILAGEESWYGIRKWTHSALIVSTQGDIIEAQAKGVVRAHASKYNRKPTQILYFPEPSNDPRRAYAVRYAEALIGQPYGKVGFVGLALNILTPEQFVVSYGRTPICSQLCAAATECMTDHGWSKPAAEMMPLGLAVDLGYEAPKPPLPYWKRWLRLAQVIWWVRPWK